MRILIVDHNHADAELTRRIFPVGAHDIVFAPDIPRAVAALDEADADVVLLEGTLPNGAATDLARRIRSREAGTHTYVIFTQSKLVANDIRVAFHAGADDFIRKPLAREELLARCEGPARVMRWASRVIAMTASSGVLNRDLSTITAWTSLESYVTSEIGEMLGVDLAGAPSENVLAGASCVSMLALTSAKENIEVRFAVGIDESASRALGRQIYGNEDIAADERLDMIREMANLTAGAFKRMAASEGHEFTTGLPIDTRADDLHRDPIRARRQWFVTCADKGLVLRFEVQLRGRVSRRLPVSALGEGMVLLADVLTDSGVLLMRAGTRLTESHLPSLKRALSDRRLVEVTETT